VAIVEGLMERASSWGASARPHRDLASLATFGMCNWAHQWYRPGGRMRPREIAYQFWSYPVYGLGTGQLAGVPLARATPRV
jgi:hypothetical protein